MENEKRYTESDLRDMGKEEYTHLLWCLEYGLFSFLGIAYAHHITWFTDPENGDIVIQWD